MTAKQIHPRILASSHPAACHCLLERQEQNRAKSKHIAGAFLKCIQGAGYKCTWGGGGFHHIIKSGTVVEIVYLTDGLVGPCATHPV